MPVLSPGYSSPLGVDSAGKHAVVIGTPAGRKNDPPGPLVVDLGTGAVRPLQAGWANVSAASAWAVSRDGESLLVSGSGGLALERIVSVPLNGRTPAQTLFTVSSLVWYLDSAADGSVYVSLMDRPGELVRRSLAGSQAEQVASFSIIPDTVIAVLPDGRAVVTVATGGRTRLAVVDKGKDPVPLVSTSEETSAPMTPAGSREIAFVIGPAPHQTIAVADTSTGGISRRIPLNKEKSHHWLPPVPLIDVSATTVRRGSDDEGNFARAGGEVISGAEVSSDVETSGTGSFPLSTTARRVRPPVATVTTARPSGSTAIAVSGMMEKLATCSAWLPASERRTNSLAGP